MIRYVAAAFVATILVIGIATAMSMVPIAEFARHAVVIILGSPEFSRPNVIEPLTPDLQARCALGFEPWRQESAPVQRYWASERFGETGDFAADWLSTQLCAMGEEPLPQPRKSDTILRFLWLRSFHPGVVVRVERRDAVTMLFAVELSGAGGYAPGTVARREERALSDSEWASIERAVDQSHFWSLPTRKHVHALDGATWVVEISEFHRYHLVDRWSGDEITPIGLQLLSLSGLQPNPVY